MALDKVPIIFVYCAFPLFLISYLLGCSVSAQTDADLACTWQPGRPLCKFVDALEQPPVINGATGSPIRLGAYLIEQKMHRDLPPTKLYGYGTSAAAASVPGPTIEARWGISTTVVWENHLHFTAAQHLLKIDRSLSWANPKDNHIPMVPHLHGAQVISNYDGHPDAWWTALGETGKTFSSSIFTYPNSQDAGHSWYHDHTMGINRLNVVAGLAGMYVLRDPFGMERFNSIKKLPSGDYEKLLLIQDRNYFANGSMDFPSVGVVPKAHPHWIPEYFGSAISVNNKIFPFLNVERSLYRLRIVDASNARFYNLTLSHGKPFVVVGSDGNYLSRAVQANWLVLVPGERTDILVDFTTSKIGDEVILMNSANAPFPGGDPVDEQSNTVMKFIVKSESRQRHAVYPRHLRRQFRIPIQKATQFRHLTLTETVDPLADAPVHSNLGGMRWTDPPTELARKGATELWNLINLTEDAHAIHIHMAHFQIISRIYFDAEQYKAGNCTLPDAGGVPATATMPSCYSGGRGETVEAYEAGFKDTARVMPGQVTKIIVRYANTDGSPYSFDATSGPGYVWHCHMLDHEDNDMMRPLIITH